MSKLEDFILEYKRAYLILEKDKKTITAHGCTKNETLAYIHAVKMQCIADDFYKYILKMQKKPISKKRAKEKNQKSYCTKNTK